MQREKKYIMRLYRITPEHDKFVKGAVESRFEKHKGESALIRSILDKAMKSKAKQKN